MADELNETTRRIVGEMIQRMADADTAVVLTAKRTQTILDEGGTAAWRLDPAHARQCTYAVCTRNAHAEWTEGPEPHHTAFVIGKIKDVVPTRPGHGSRYLIQFSEYATINVPNAWLGGRNPIRYGTLKEMGIDPTTLEWKPMPSAAEAAVVEPVTAQDLRVGPLTMAQAKQGLAQTFNVSPDAIEITIRG